MVTDDMSNRTELDPPTMEVWMSALIASSTDTVENNAFEYNQPV